MQKTGIASQGSPQPHKRRPRKPSAARLLMGAIEAGLTVRGIELDAGGTLRVLVGEPSKEKPAEAGLDRAMSSEGGRK